MRLDFALRHNHVNPIRVALHRHDALELVYYTKGHGLTLVHGVNHPFRPGFFAVIPSGMEHDQQDTGPVVSLCFGLAGSGLEPLAGGYRDPGGALRVVCEAVLTELASRQPGWETILQGLLQQMAGLVQRAAATAGNAPPQRAAGAGRKRQLMEEAAAIIRNRGGMVTVNELSKELFVSHDYLRHLFLEQAGESPMRRIIQTRLERARDLLCGSDLSVGEVAARSGFDSPYYFSRLFKQVFGHPPSEHRRRNDE